MSVREQALHTHAGCREKRYAMGKQYSDMIGRTEINISSLKV